MTARIISICIPSFNRPNQIKDLLDSIDCNKNDIEIVICEDMAPRRIEVREIVKNFSNLSNYSINYVENSINKGFDGNLRTLIEIAKGHFILFMGDDDKFISGELEKYISFVKMNLDKAYILRSYMVKHSDGSLEYFKYLPKNQILPPGQETVAWLFKRSVTICGFTISRDKALKFSTNEVDGTLLYQVYLMAQICLKNESIYYEYPFVQCAQEYRKNKPMFGSSKFEKSRYQPGSISSDNSINFTKSYFELTKYFDNINCTNITKLVLIDLSKYSYPFLSIQRKNGIKNFLKYSNRLQKEIGLGCTIYFHLYKWALIFLGENFCDKLIIFTKRLFGRTPKL